MNNLNHNPSYGAWNNLKISRMGILAAISIALILTVRIPFGPAPYLVFDLADIPILLGAFTISPLAGLMILGAVSLIQAFALGGNGIIGFIMGFTSSGAMIVMASYLYRRLGASNRSLLIGLVSGALTMTALMMPLNIIFTPILFGMPMQAVIDLIIPVLLPFNLIKSVLNCVLFFALYKALKPLNIF